MPKIAPYGSWASPISADMVANGLITLVGLVLDGKGLYWLESRPSEGGRRAIMHLRSDATIVECTPAEYYVRTTVHEYGGGDFTVADGTIFFANFSDQRLYMQPPAGDPTPLTSGNSYRYADMIVDPARGRLICIREDHSGSGEAINTIVGVGLGGAENVTVLAHGNDFYATPRLSPDGSQLAYLTWNHPNMPWDGCELWLADVGSDGALSNQRLVFGGPSEAVFQPEWSPRGKLYFAAEPTGWWNLYVWADGKAEPLFPMEAEFGRPQWVFGASNYGFVSEDRILACYTENGVDRLAWLDTSTHEFTPLTLPYADIDYLRCGPGVAAFIGGSPTTPESVVRVDIRNNEVRSVRQTFEVTVGEGNLSIPEPVDFRTEQGRTSHAFYYAPKNEDFGGPAGERPP